MSDKTYVFNTATDETERRRLQLLESVYDPYTVNWMNGIDIKPGMSCLEVGPGAGSMVRWLSERVGRCGWVTAVDTSPRFVSPPYPHANVEVVKGDLNRGVGHALYDLVYARFVVVHQPGHDEAIKTLIDAVKPGGWLLLADADFTTARPMVESHSLASPFTRGMDALIRFYAGRGIDPAFGSTMVDRLTKVGLVDVAGESVTSMVRGGAPLSRLMGDSWAHLKPTLVEKAEADPTDIDGFVAACYDPTFLAIHDTFSGAWGRRPR